MGVRMKVPYDDGTNKLEAGDVCLDFSPRMEGRLIRSGLAVQFGGRKGLAHAREQAGMEPLAEEDPASMRMTKDELLDLAEERGVTIETDDNKADLVRKINETD